MRKYLRFLIFLSLVLVSCNGYDTEELGEFNSSQGVDDDRTPDSEPGLIEPDTDPIKDPIAEPVPEPAPFKCIKSKDHDPLFMDSSNIILKACTKASSKQLAEVNKGNKKKNKFLARCYKETGNSCWCDQLTRPNPSSVNTFRCTYGSGQPHTLIHPDESTWKYAIEAAKIVIELERKGLGVKIIYNWWRPEPYNKNVSGSATRHPFGTSVDVRFVSKSVQNKAHSELCKMRKKGRLRALGYYQSSALHFGVGDHNPNTWGKSCP